MNATLVELGLPVLDTLKRLFAKKEADPDLTEVMEWAQRRGHGFKRARGGSGFVIDGLLEAKPWRIEWGPSQRPYIAGRELRVRMELELPSDLQMLVMSRRLMEVLERQTFEQFTDNVQTQIGTKTPEEMRWLVMFPKVDLAEMKILRSRFGAVAMSPDAGLSWIEGPLAHMLEEAAHGFLREDPPFVLMTLRSRAYLRMQLDEPIPKDLAAALAVFETSVAQALGVSASMIKKASGDGRDKGRNTVWPMTGSTAWQTMHGDLPDPGDAGAPPAGPHLPR